MKTKKITVRAKQIINTARFESYEYSVERVVVPKKGESVEKVYKKASNWVKKKVREEEDLVRDSMEKGH